MEPVVLVAMAIPPMKDEQDDAEDVHLVIHTLPRENKELD